MKVRIKGLRKGKNLISLVQTAEDKNIKFDEFEQMGPLKVEGSANVFDDGIHVQLNISVPASFTCARCTEDYIYNINSNTSATYSFNPKPTMAEEEEFFEYIKNDQVNIDFTELALETIHLNIPIQPVCNNDCAGLCACGKNLNLENCVCNCKNN